MKNNEKHARQSHWVYFIIAILVCRIISINRGRLGRGAEDVLLKNQELMS